MMWATGLNKFWQTVNNGNSVPVTILRSLKCVGFKWKPFGLCNRLGYQWPPINDASCYLRDCAVPSCTDTETGYVTCFSCQWDISKYNESTHLNTCAL